MMAEKQFIERFIMLMKEQDNLIAEMQALSQRESDLVVEMQSLAQEFQEHAGRLRSVQDRFHRFPAMPRAEGLEGEEAKVVKLDVTGEFPIPQAVKPNRQRGGE